MQYLHIKDINLHESINTRVYGIFMAHNVDVRQQKNGQKFISLLMCDKDIKIEAKKFGATDDEINMMFNGGVYCAAIDVKPYNGVISCVLYNFDKYNEDPSNFIEYADGMEHAQEVVQEALKVIGESIYKNVVYSIINDNWQNFNRWSAASSMHHDMMGGLLVHTAEVIEQSKIIAQYWQSKYGEHFINMPLLLSGALIHDIGKIQELDVDASGNTEYSTHSSLETHIISCITLIDIAAYKYQFGYKTDDKSEEQLNNEKEALDLLKHVVLSHHGKLEYGSPITPNIPEASIISTADGMSAEMFRFNKTLNSMEPKTSYATWLSGKMVNTYKDSTKI